MSLRNPMIDSNGNDGYHKFPSSGKPNQDDQIIRKYHPKPFCLVELFAGSTLQATRQILEKFHSNNPLKTGISREELRSKLKLNSKIFTLIIEDWISRREIKK